MELPLFMIKMMGVHSNPLNFRGLGYQGKHQIYFQTDPSQESGRFDFGHLPTKNESHLQTPANLVLQRVTSDTNINGFV